MDLSFQDEDESDQDEDNNFDIAKELIMDYQPSKDDLKVEKLHKKKKVKELNMEVQEYDEKSLSKVQQIKRILNLAELENKITLTLATRLLNLFRLCIKISSDPHKIASKDDDEEVVVESKGKDKELEIILSSNASLYKEVIKASVSKLPKIILALFDNKFDLENVNEENFKIIKRAVTKKNQTVIMRSFIANYIKLLKGGSDDTESFLISVVDCVKFALPFKVYRKMLIIALCDIMCKYYEVSSDCILICFDALRKLIRWNVYIRDDLTTFAYKKFLNSFGEQSKIGGAGATSSKTRENLRLLENCFCELLSVDYVAAYQVGFGLIRKLSTVCRSARISFSAKSMRLILNWRFHHCLHLLSVVLYTLTLKSSELELLIYPFIQLCIAVLGMSQNNTKYFPFTLKICRMLNNLNTVSQELYIPVSQYLLHLFTGTDDFLNRQTRAAKDALPNYEVAIKIGKEFYNATETKDFVFRSLIQELKSHLEIIKGSMSFPELVIPICQVLSQFKRRCKNPPYYNVIRELYEKIRGVTDKIIEFRKNVDLLDIKACQKAKIEIDLGTCFIKQTPVNN